MLRGRSRWLERLGAEGTTLTLAGVRLGGGYQGEFPRWGGVTSGSSGEENPGELESGSAIPNYPVSGSPRPPPSALWLGAGVGKGARRVETRNGPFSPQLSIPAFGGGDGRLELRVKFGDFLWFPDDLFNTDLGS